MSHSQALMILLISVFSYLVATVYIYDLVNAIGLRLKRRFWLKFAPLMLLNTVLVYVLTLACNKGAMNGLSYAGHPAFLAVCLALELLLAGAALQTLLHLRRRKRLQLSPASLQEGLDKLPDGICFASPDGIPLLVNSKMQSLCLQVLGTSLIDTVDVKRRFQARDFRQGCSATKLNGSTLLHLPDGSVWGITDTLLTVGGSRVEEFVAYEVTEQYLKNRELEIRNTHLEEINKQLKEYDNNLDAIIREREILAAKVKLHDNLGRALLALRAYLSQKTGDRETLVSLWRFTVSVLRREAVEKDDENRIDVLTKAAEAVDVRLLFDGDIPPDGKANELIAMAIQECLTNVVKHAEGTCLFIKTRKQNGAYTVEITNDGKRPAKTITEKGGLKNLRKTVEMRGGTMEIESLPQFVLRMRLTEG